MSHCRFNKFRYDPDDAQGNYEKILIQSRQGLDLDEAEVNRLAATVVPAINRGLSPEQIIHLYPDLGLCVNTLYTYIDRGVFNKWNIGIINLRQKVKRRMTKKQKLIYKKRKDYKYLLGRKYDDYLEYMDKHPESLVVQMDTVYNQPEGPYLQTFKILKWDFFLAIWQDRKTSENMVKGVNLLAKILEEDLFRQVVQVLLTDRGTEFSNPQAIEKGERTKVFYCDPMSPGQKGSLEKRHSELRYIVSKKKTFTELRLLSQDKTNRICSHLNSVPRAKTLGKTPFELANFYCPEFVQKIQVFGVIEVPKDQVNLTPQILK